MLDYSDFMPSMFDCYASPPVACREIDAALMSRRCDAAFSDTLPAFLL